MSQIAYEAAVKPFGTSGGDTGSSMVMVAILHYANNVVSLSRESDRFYSQQTYIYQRYFD